MKKILKKLLNSFLKRIKFLFILIRSIFVWFNRDKNLIVVISAHNNFTGNCKYAVMALQNNFPKKQIVWFVDNNEQVLALEKQTGIKAIRYDSRNNKDYIKTISKAGYILSDCGFVEYYIANGAYQIDFWHGGKIKKIRLEALNIEPDLNRRLIRWLNRNRWICSGTSQFDVDVYCDSGRLSRKMGQILGTPCIAPLVDKNVLNSEIKKDKKLITLKNEIKKYNKVFLYAPTFRDSGVDFLTNLNFDIKKLQKTCADKNILLLIKMHPLCNLELNQQYNNVQILDKFYDATVLIAMCDVVISDYSSMSYYAMAGGKELIYMHGDISEYRKNNRDIYDWAIADMCGHIIKDFNDLCELIKNDIPIKPVPNYIFDKYWDKQIINNTYKFLEVLTE